MRFDTDEWFDFDEQVVLVNGCGGIGREIVGAFAHHDATVIPADIGRVHRTGYDSGVAEEPFGHAMT